MSYKQEGHTSLSPYALVADAAAELAFVKAVFGTEPFQMMHGDDGAIRHAAVMIDDTVLMLGQMPGGQPMNLHVYVPDVDATYAKAIEAGATSFEEPAQQFYGDRRAAATDPCGITWWFATRTGQPG